MVKITKRLAKRFLKIARTSINSQNFCQLYGWQVLKSGKRLAKRFRKRLLFSSDNRLNFK
jgi:hypothetical protein